MSLSSAVPFHFALLLPLLLQVDIKYMIRPESPLSVCALGLMGANSGSTDRATCPSVLYPGCACELRTNILCALASSRVLIGPETHRRPMFVGNHPQPLSVEWDLMFGEAPRLYVHSFCSLVCLLHPTQCYYS